MGGRRPSTRLKWSLSAGWTGHRSPSRCLIRRQCRWSEPENNESASRRLCSTFATASGEPCCTNWTACECSSQFCPEMTAMQETGLQLWGKGVTGLNLCNSNRKGICSLKRTAGDQRRHDPGLQSVAFCFPQNPIQEQVTGSAQCSYTALLCCSRGILGWKWQHPQAKNCCRCQSQHNFVLTWQMRRLPACHSG